jgi:hypothetical protein
MRDLIPYEIEADRVELANTPCTETWCSTLAYWDVDIKRCACCGRELCPDHQMHVHDAVVCERCSKDARLMAALAPDPENPIIPYRIEYPEMPTEQEDFESQPDDYRNSVPRGM